MSSKLIRLTASALEHVRDQVQKEHHEDSALLGAPALLQQNNTKINDQYYRSKTKTTPVLFTLKYIIIQNV